MMMDVPIANRLEVDRPTADLNARTALPGSIPELLPRLQRLCDEGRTEMALTTLKIPIAHYNDLETLAAERREILEKVPLFIGISVQVANPGDFFTRDLLGRPILITRGKDGRARVFINACRHRGAKVAEGEGCQSRFTCPYHAWTFDGSGKCIGMPGAEGFDDVDRLTLGLVELPSEERHGIIFAQLDRTRAIDLDEHLGSMGDELSTWNYESLEFDSTLGMTYRANWKSTLEAFAETYHFPFVHANSGPGRETVSNVVSFDNFGPHHRIGVPIKGMVEPEKFPHHQGCSVLHWIYPNVIMANSRMGTEFIDILPLGPHETSFRHTLTIRADINLPAAYKKAFGDSTRYAITHEDPLVIESAAAGLRHAGHEFALIGRNEPGPQNIHRQIQIGIGLP